MVILKFPHNILWYGKQRASERDLTALFSYESEKNKTERKKNCSFSSRRERREDKEEGGGGEMTRKECKGC